MKTKRISKGNYAVSTSLTEYRIRRPFGDNLWQISNAFGTLIDYAVSKAEAIRIIEQREGETKC